MKSINCSEFDGNGFTIKNCFINEDDYYGSASFFTRGIKSVKNVTFENVEIKSTGGISAAVVVSGDCEKINNVRVNNCKITCTQPTTGNNLTKSARKCYVGGIYGGYSPSYKNGTPTEYFGCNITGCAAENISIELNGCTNDAATAAEMYAGGIAGGCNDISNCFIADSKIIAQSTGIFNYPFIGGIVANSHGTVEKCYSKNNDFYAKATHYSASGSGYTSSKAYMGGIAAYVKSSGKLRYSFTQDTHLSVNCSGSIYIGGVAGYVDGAAVNQCYSNNNYILMQGYSEKANVTWAAVKPQRRAGGLLGASLNNSVTSCFAYNEDTIAEHNVSILNRAEDSKASGLIASFNSINVSFCAAYSKNLISSITDAFIPVKTSISNCYIDGDRFGNLNNCTPVSHNFWTDSDEIKTKLNLAGANWKFEENKIPNLDFTKK